MAWFSGYPGESPEAVAELEATSMVLGYSYQDLGASLPDIIDPWILDKDLLPTEDQLQIGSCQGNSLTENLEYCYYVHTGEIIQASRIMAYLGSQKYDGINSDDGSTLNGGTKLVEGDGICLESVMPYPNRYPSNGPRAITQAAWADAQKRKLANHLVIKDWDGSVTFLGAGKGIIQIGIPWDDSMTPDQYGCMDEWKVGRNYGGHAIVLCGYVPDDIVKKKSPENRRLILKNSWNRRWGINGRAYVTKRWFDAAVRHQFSVMLGRTDMIGPEPRPLPDDLTNPNKGMYV